MKRFLVALSAIALAAAFMPFQALAQGNQYIVRYRGGPVAPNKKAEDFGDTLTVNPEVMTLALQDGQKLTINPKRVTTLSYGKEATKRVKPYAGVAVIIPFVLVKFRHKTTKHFIGIEYTTEDGKQSAVLVQAQDDDYRGLLASLESVTGKQALTGKAKP